MSLVTTSASFSLNKPSNSNCSIAEKTLAAVARSVVLSGALFGGLAVPAAFAGDVGAGEQIFKANCAVCHSGGQNVIIPNKTLEKDALEQYLYGGMSEESVARQVKNGKNAMPAFGGRLRDEDIENVSSYVIESSEAGWADYYR